MKSAREEILDRLKNAFLPEPEMPDFKAPVYHPIEGPLDEAFKKRLELVNGKVFIFQNEKALYQELATFLGTYPKENICCNEKELTIQLEDNNIQFSCCEELPESIEVGITSCEFLIAHTGSVMVSSLQQGGRQLFIYPPVHVVVARKNQIVDYLEDAYEQISKKYQNNLPSHISLITGPSRTADIEKTLILGAHGPKDINVFLY